jgi:hypothetical protein
VLDASGRPGDIFYSGSAKMIVTDSNAVTIDTFDPVGGDSLSASDIKTLYESNSDTNEYSDTEKTKLAGIESLADVTDATNVAAAISGASISSVTPTTSDKVLIQDASDSDNLKTATVGEVAALQDWSGFGSLANGEYIGIAAEFVAGTTIAAGKAVGANTSTAGRVSLYSYSNISNTEGRFVGIALESGTAGQTINVLLYGFMCLTSWTWGVGDVVFLDNTVSGDLTDGAVTGTQTNAVAGVAVDTDILYLSHQA